jgi:hypothetical protein
MAHHMLTDEFPFLAPLNLRRDTSLVVRLRALADDIGRIRAGERPIASDLAHAPTIDRWRPVLTAHGVCLAGRIEGHPALGSCFGTTTQIWAADPGGSWIRTLSRFYRLECPSSIGFDGIWEMNDV